MANKEDSIRASVIKLILGILCVSLIFIGENKWLGHNARSYEIEKAPKWQEIRQIVSKIPLLDTKESFGNALRMRSRELTVWAENKFNSNYSEDEIINYYQNQLTEHGWSKFEYKEVFLYNPKQKFSDEYISQKGDYEIRLSFVISYNNPENLPKDVKARQGDGSSVLRK